MQRMQAAAPSVLKQSSRMLALQVRVGIGGKDNMIPNRLAYRAV